MIFSYNWLQSLIARDMPKLEKLAELLTMHSFEVEEIKKVDGDWAINIDVLPNRAGDCFSHIGIAREIAAVTNSKLRLSKIKTGVSAKSDSKDFITVEVQNKKDCPRYTAKVISGVKVGNSPKWIQERLKSCGLRPINNIVDAVNYAMLETGQPLHAFDFDKIEVSAKNADRVKKLIVRRAKKGEKILTLDGDKYDLNDDILVIADGLEPLVIAGIKGGKKAEIDNKTKTIVLESANFNPSLIRFVSRKLGLRTDASERFEQGIDANLTEQAINRASNLIADVAGGRIANGLADFYPKKSVPKRIKVDLDYASRLLGIKIADAEIKKILENLEIQTQNWSTKSFIAAIPTFRLDLVLEEDVIEEIGRFCGYEKIPVVFPSSVLLPAKRNDDVFWQEMATNILKSAGFTEVYNYSFIGETDADIFGYLGDEFREVLNPISAEYKYLRPSLIINLLKDFQKNQNQFSSVKIFELGKVFGASFGERRMLAGLLSGDSFYVAKGALDALAQGMGISNIWYDDYKPMPEETLYGIWKAQSCAAIKMGDAEIGFVGEIDSRLLYKLDVSGIVIVFDLDFEKLTALATEEQIYRPVSRYPAAVRDIAVLVPLNTRVEKVLNIINTTGGELISDVDLFDIYEGEELPAGKKNLAFRIIYQAKDHTLTSGEIDKLQKKVIAALDENVEWEVRK